VRLAARKITEGVADRSPINADGAVGRHRRTSMPLVIVRRRWSSNTAQHSSICGFLHPWTADASARTGHHEKPPSQGLHRGRRTTSFPWKKHAAVSAARPPRVVIAAAHNRLRGNSPRCSAIEISRNDGTFACRTNATIKSRAIPPACQRRISPRTDPAAHAAE
jgi:hypothetical protein